jgi:DMSO/TMAO reductase YedYZ heme-binding membrane subunit
MVLLDRLRKDWLRILVHVGALLPLVWTLWQYGQGLFLIDPVREITTRTGKTALILLVLSLACTPLNTVLGFKAALRVRRALGLYAFLYASLHFATFVGLDYGFDVSLLVHFAWLVKDIREPLWYGAVLFLLLVLRVPRVRQETSRARRRLAAMLPFS